MTDKSQPDQENGDGDGLRKEALALASRIDLGEDLGKDGNGIRKRTTEVLRLLAAPQTTHDAVEGEDARPRCAACNLEDGACICAHIKPNSMHASTVQMPEYKYQEVDNRTGSISYREPSAPPKPAPSLDTNSVADSTGEKTGTHGASKEAGGHSRGGLTPVSTLSQQPAPDAMREAPLDLVWEEINALGGVPEQNNSYDQGCVDTVGKALEIVEKFGGSDPAPNRSHLSAPVPPADGAGETLAFNRGAREGWMRCGVYHIDLDFEGRESELVEINRRWPIPPSATGAAEPVLDAFDLGFAWARSLHGQRVEDSRAVGRTLLSDLFAGLDINISGFDSFKTGDEGIVEAKRRIKAALSARYTRQAPHSSSETDSDTQ